MRSERTQKRVMSRRVWAKWFVEGKEEPYTKVVHPIDEK
jgi:hypothetical protein